MNIRLAIRADLPAIFDIYNHEIVHSTATFDTKPVTVENRELWLDQHSPEQYPVLVADCDGAVRGWACLSPWSERCAYARAAEVSVYVDKQWRGRGIGKSLLTALAQRARTIRLGVLLARISSGESNTSLALHESIGFKRIGTMRRVGEKFGRILDVELLDLQLDG